MSGSRNGVSCVLENSLFRWRVRFFGRSVSDFRRRAAFATLPCSGWLWFLGAPIRSCSPALWRDSSAPLRELAAPSPLLARGRRSFARPAAIGGLPGLTGPSVRQPLRVTCAHPRWRPQGDRGPHLGFPSWCGNRLRNSGFAEASGRRLRARAAPRWTGRARVRQSATRAPAQQRHEDQGGRGGDRKSVV